MIASETSNIGALFVALAIITIALVLAVTSALWAATNIARSDQGAFVTGSRPLWLIVMAASPPLAAVTCFRFVSSANESLTYSNDDPFFWVAAALMLTASGTVGPLSWYVTDWRRRVPSENDEAPA